MLHRLLACAIVGSTPIAIYKQLKQHIGLVQSEFTPADLTAMQYDLAINQIATSKVETGIQQKWYL